MTTSLTDARPQAELADILVTEPSYRWRQIYSAWFDPNLDGFFSVTSLPQALRQRLENLPWLSVKLKTIQISQLDGTKKALLELADGNFIETVLMGRMNKRATRLNDERYTICISTQVGCPMGCVFCATGKMGFRRNLTVQEIVDQVRFWMRYLIVETPPNLPLKGEEIAASPPFKEGAGGRSRGISNIVLMGQGEPLLNYDHVKQALNIILKYGGLGPRQIIVSTVGVPDMMEKMVADPDWPPVRFALSLHNPLEEERKKLIPSHQKDFLKFLVDWSKKYHARFGARTQFIGLEYTIVPGENDGEKHLKALIKLASKLGKVRINLIPLNTTVVCHPERSEGSPSVRNRRDSSVLPQNDNLDTHVIDRWHERLMECGFTATIRHSQGQDIAAACGQLALENEC